MDGFIENKTFDEIEIGDTASIQHTLTKHDIELFAIMSGDVNPAHLDEEYARSDMFHKIIAHGMWGGSFISTVLGTELPGPGTIYLSQTFKFLKPVIIGDTITARVTVRDKNLEKSIITFDCACSNQSGKEVISGEAVVIAPDEKVKRKRVQLPDIEFKKEMCPNYHRIICKANGLNPIRTAIVHPVDELSLKGAICSQEAGLIDPILIGPEDKIKLAAERANITISSAQIINAEHSHDAAEKAVQMAYRKEVEAIMKGKIHTDELMHAVVNKKNGLCTERRMSHVIMADIPAYKKPLFITDAAINIDPNLIEKKDIVQNAIDLFRSLYMGVPRVAIISAVETVNEKIKSTLDATALCKMAERNQIYGALLDGPLAFDNAVSEDAARTKSLNSKVAGKADILVVPNLESGNILLKQLTLFSGASIAGVVMGARVPIILTSRSSHELSRKASCALALLTVHHGSNNDYCMGECEK